MSAPPASAAAPGPTTTKSVDAAADRHHRGRRGKILLLGDSLTQFGFEGWARSLADRYQRRADVLNRGASGYSTRWYLKHAETETATTSGIWTINEEGDDVRLVTIWFGANDAATLEQGVPLEEYRENLGRLIDSASSSYPEASVLLITPPPVAERQRAAYLERTATTTTTEEGGGDSAAAVAVRTNEKTGTYAAACKAVAADRSVPCLDLFAEFTEAAAAAKANTESTTANEKDDEKDNDDGGLAAYFTDGLHFGPAGHDLVSRSLIRAIDAELPDLAIKPCPITGQFCNSGSSCGDGDGFVASGPFHDDIKRAQSQAQSRSDETASSPRKKRGWEDAFDATNDDDDETEKIVSAATAKRPATEEGKPR